MNRAFALVVAAALLTASAFLARASDAARPTARAAPGAASLLGGFSAVAVQVLWMRADQAILDRREDDALVAFAAITELEPQLVSAGDHIARALGYNLADGHEDPAVRWSLCHEGWRVLCRTVERNPAEPRAYGARARYALLRVHRDAALRAAFVREADPLGPAESALRDAETAIALRAEWVEPWQIGGLAAFARANEFFEEGDFDGAIPRYARAAAMLRRVASEFRATGDPELAPAAERNEADALLAEALAHVAGSPAGARAAEYDDLRHAEPDAKLPALSRR